MTARSDAASLELWRLPTVMQKTGRARTTIYDSIRAHTFPRPVSLGGRTVAWSSVEVQDWIDARIAERDAKTSSRLDGQTGAGGAA